MAHKTKINGTTYSIKGGKTKVNGTAYSIKKGMTKVNGTGYAIKFSEPVKVYSNGWSNSQSFIQVKNATTNVQYSTGSTAKWSYTAQTGDVIQVDGYVWSTSGSVNIYLNGKLVKSGRGTSGTAGVNYNYWISYSFELTGEARIEFTRSSAAVAIKIVMA